MVALSTAVCSVTRTQRRRYFWAAWWTGAPSHVPFRKPDAANGGAKTAPEALAEAERVAGRRLTSIDPYWARAWSRVLRGQAVPPPPAAGARARPVSAAQEQKSAWAVLGLEAGASAAAIREAFHKQALETHPDQGGDADRFRAVMRAFERLTRKRKPRRTAAERKRK